MAVKSSLDGMTLDELRQLASKHDVAGAAQLGRADLLRALEAALATASSHTLSSNWPTHPTEYNTEAMGRMFLEQGLPERAVEIFRELLAARPGDELIQQLLVEAEHAVERGRRHRAAREQTAAAEAAAAEAATPSAPPADHGEPFGILDFEELPEAYGVDEVELLFKDPHTVFVYWEITDAGMAAARAHLGDEADEAKLVLRLFSTPPRGSEAGRVTRDIPLDGWRGRRYLPTPRPGVTLRAATGLVARSGLFAPIANSSSVRVPPAEPAPPEPAPVEWIEVQPARYAGEKPEPIEITRRLTTPATTALPDTVTGPPPEGAGSPPSSWRRRPGSGDGK